MDKAARLAIMSAAFSRESSLTFEEFFILPNWTRSVFHNYTHDPNIHRLCVVSKVMFMFRKPDFWRTGVDYANISQWGVNLFMIADSAGLGWWHLALHVQER